MRWLQALPTTLLHIWRWLRRTPHLTEFSIIAAVIVVFICQALGYHQDEMPFIPNSGDSIPLGWVDPPNWMLFFNYVRPYLQLCFMLGTIVFLIHWIRVWPNLGALVWPTIIICSLLALKALIGEAYDHWDHENYSYMGEPRSPIAYAGKVLMLLILLATPPLMVWWLSRRTILETYTLKTFLQPLIFCFIGFSSLWILMDLIDALKDYQQAGTDTSDIAWAYIKMLPFIYVSVAPASLLLAVLYSLTRMSRSNEIIAMLTAGRSLWEILRPLYVVAAYASLIGMVANYHWAPRGEGQRLALLKDKSEKKSRRASLATSVLHRNEQTGRTWYVASVPADALGDKLRDVSVRQTDEKGRMLHGWYATSARWWPGPRVWSFYGGVEVLYEKKEAKDIQQFPVVTRTTGVTSSRLDMEGWTETPWSIISSALAPDNMGVPELATCLEPDNGVPAEKLGAFELQLYQRFSVPWQCLFIVMTTAPLGIAYSRRGSIGGIAIAVFFFFGLLFMDNLFSSMVKGQHLPAWLGVWMPHLILGIIAVVLFLDKSQSKHMPELTPSAIFAKLKALVQRTPEPAMGNARRGSR